MKNFTDSKKGFAPKVSMVSVPLGFLFLILIGAALLMLPLSTAPGNHTTPLTALFTSTTSVCVTGSVVVDTCTHWSLFGKLIILGLIQLGGLGIIAMVMFILSIAERSVSLGDTLMLKDMFSLESTQGIFLFIRRIFFTTVIIELIWAIAFTPVFCPHYGAARGIWYSIFTSVSAFCNAGIHIVDPNSLENYNNSPLILIVTMLLIVAGGLGYIVLNDILPMPKRFRQIAAAPKPAKRLREHTRLVLVLTAGLIVSGAVLIFALEYNNPGTIGKMPLGQKILNSFFQSVTTRTAGFSTVPQENLTETSSFVGIILMFIGGSPLGTAGGVKTVTIFILLKNVYTYIMNEHDVVVYKRTIPPGLIRKSSAIITVQFTVVLVITGLLMAASNANLTDALYEVMSAVNTVGLSRGLTGDLNVAGQIIIIIGMFLGRVGPITMLLFFKNNTRRADGIQYADGKYIVG